MIGAIVLRYPAIPYRGYRSAWRTPTAGLQILCSDERIPSSDLTWRSRVAKEIEISCKNREYIRLFQEETVHGSEILRDWLKEDYDDSDWSEVFNYRSDLLAPSVSPMFMKERPIPLLYEKSATVFDYFKDALVVVCESGNMLERLKNIEA